MQELTRFLAESLGDVITLQQGAAEEPRRDRARDPRAGAPEPRPAAGPDGRAPGAARATWPTASTASCARPRRSSTRRRTSSSRARATELDRSVLEKITAPFEHLLRNADRATAWRRPRSACAPASPRSARSRSTRAQRGNEVVLDRRPTTARASNFARIREKAIEAGPARARRGAARRAARAVHLHARLLHRDGSDRRSPGRGVGMDVVKNEITSLGGRVEIASDAGRGHHLHASRCRSRSR